MLFSEKRTKAREKEKKVEVSMSTTANLHFGMEATRSPQFNFSFQLGHFELM